MGRITVSVNDSVVRAFREIAKKKFGHEKGVLSKAIDEALVAWIKER